MTAISKQPRTYRRTDEQHSHVTELPV